MKNNKFEKSSSHLRIKVRLKEFTPININMFLKYLKEIKYISAEHSYRPLKKKIGQAM